MLTDLDYELLSAYIDGALTDSERAAFELRLQAEPELSRELVELRATITLLNNLPPRKAPRDFTLDARYARRSTFFFTSATFSALSTAAAIILFALGAYLFTGNKSVPAATGSVSQAPQLALASTATGTTLDKAAATTATEPQLFNEIEPSSTLENGSAGGGLFVPDDVLPLTVTVVTSEETDQSQAQANIAQSTLAGTLSDGAAVDSAAGSAADTQAQTQVEGRTSVATETITNQPYPAPSSSNSAETAPSAPLIEPSVVTEPYSAAPAFAATQPPPSTSIIAPTVAPTDTVTPTSTVTASPAPTATSTPLPTATPQPAPVVAPNTSDSLSIIFIVLGAVLLIVAIGTTLMRRRNRP